MQQRQVDELRHDLVRAGIVGQHGFALGVLFGDLIVHRFEFVLLFLGDVFGLGVLLCCFEGLQARIESASSASMGARRSAVAAFSPSLTPRTSGWSVLSTRL